MPKATDQERAAVDAAVAEASAPFKREAASPPAQSAMRTAIYHALYALACKRIIPPDLKLDVSVSVDANGVATVQLSDDLVTWLSAPVDTQRQPPIDPEIAKWMDEVATKHETN